MKRTTTWTFQMAKLGDLIVSFGWQIVAARLLVPSEFGQVAVATALATFIVIVASLGGDELIASAPPKHSWFVFRRELFIRLASVAAILTGATACTLINQPLASATLVYSAAFAASSLVAALNAREYQAKVLVTGVVLQGAAVVGLLLAVKPSTGAETMLIVSAAVALRAVVTLCLSLVIGHRAQGEKMDRLPTSVGHRFSLVASASSGPLLGRQMHVSIAALVGVALGDIAAYSVAYSLAYLASTATILGIGAVTLPQLADAVATGDRQVVARRWRSILITTSALSIPALGISAAAAPQLIGLIYGPEYAEIGGFLYIGLACVLILQRLLGGGANNAVLIASALTRALITSILVAAAIVIGLDFLLMPLVGMWAAVVSGAASIAVSGLLMLVAVKRVHGGRTPIFSQVKVLAVTTAGIVIVVGVKWMSDYWPPAAVVAIAAGVGLAALLAVQRVVIRPAQ